MSLTINSLTYQYIRLRLRQAYFSLLSLINSIKHAIEIFIPLFGLLGLAIFALIAAPLLYAPNLATREIWSIIAAQSIICILPVWLLRNQLFPNSLADWEQALPIPLFIKFSAIFALTGCVLLPLALVYFISIFVWLYQWPIWLQPIFWQGVSFVLISFLSTWILSTIFLTTWEYTYKKTYLLTLSSRKIRSYPYKPSICINGSFKQRLFFQWYCLFWVSSWKSLNKTGLKQLYFLTAAISVAILWVNYPERYPVLAIVFSSLLILVTDYGNKAMAAQIKKLLPAACFLPIKLQEIKLLAKFFVLLPVLITLVGLSLFFHINIDRIYIKAAYLYIVFSLLAHLAIVSFSDLSERVRLILLVLSIFILSAVASELWH